MAIKQEYYKTRNDGVKLYRTYSNVTPILKQQPTNRIYKCLAYKETGEIDWEKCGVVDVENANYSYVEISEEEYQASLKPKTTFNLPNMFKG